jgi:predicted Rossmann fold flavoprotein
MNRIALFIANPLFYIMIQQYGRGWSMTVVVGASASGLTAAIVAARRGERIVVLEAGEKAARKIYASGNGRCNIGNSAISPERYHSRDMEVLAKILASCDRAQLRSYLNSLGIVTQEEAEGKLFPMSRQASSVVEALLFEAARAGVEILYGRKVVDIERGAGGYILHCESGECFETPRLLLCSGSPAAPGLGGDSGILSIVGERFGHEVLKPLPSLSALRSASRYCRMASGVKLPAKVTLLCDSLVETERRGDILFTD